MSETHPGRLFHIGVVAADLDKAMAEMSRSLGVTWKDGKPRSMTVVLDGEDRELVMRIAHTVEGPPHLELIQCVPDTPWAEPSAGTHHVCYWSETPGAACAAMEASGARRIMGRPGSEGGYFRTDSGLIVEIIGPAMRDRLSALSRGERYVAG